MFFWVLLFPVFLCLLVLLLFDVQLVVCVVGFYLIGDLWFGVCCLALVALFVCLCCLLGLGLCVFGVC